MGETNNIINLNKAKEEIVNILKSYNPVIHTNDDEGYDWLSDGNYSIIVEKNKKEILWIDLTDEITIGLGYFHSHYNLNFEDYEEFKRDLNDIVKAKICSVSIICDGQWYSSMCVDTSDLSRESLMKKTVVKQILREYKNKFKERGFRIECNFLDAAKDIIYEIPPVIDKQNEESQY